MDTKGFFNLKSSLMSELALSDSFEYLCYGYTTIISIFTLTAESDVYGRQILTTKVDPRAVRVQGLYLI